MSGFESLTYIAFLLRTIGLQLEILSNVVDAIVN